MQDNQYSIPDRPASWRMGYDDLKNVTSYNGVLLTPQPKPAQRGMPKVLLQLWDEENDRRKDWKGHQSVDERKVNDFFNQQLIKDENR